MELSRLSEGYPRDIQEALFETAIRARAEHRESLAKLLHDRHPKAGHPLSPE
jgi:hypothetical protein